MSSNAISVKNVTKIYKMYDKPIDRLKETFHPFGKQYNTPFYALNDVSFEIGRGETVGIIGTNGSGKSTILKIITGVLQPTKGEVKVNGKISALLELGAGFDMEYTGIENIYMNGAIMGYTQEEMDVKKDEILEFADIGDFVYQPVKTYSSGMLVRLAFALSINVEPDILIVDEALAVGDAFFQAKCFHKLEEIKEKGTTILFVSHDILSVKKLCKRAVWIEKGILQEVGEANKVCEKYMALQIDRTNKENEKLLSQIKVQGNKENGIHADEKITFPKLELQGTKTSSGTGKAEILSFYILDKKGQFTNYLQAGETYKFGIVAKMKEDLQNVIFGFEMENVKGVRLFGFNNYMENKLLKEAYADRIYEISFEVKLPCIQKGEYLITPAVASGMQENHVVHARLHNAIKISVENQGFNIAIIEFEAETNIVEHNKEDVFIN